jgi:DNA-binding transcriptional LysR family regulator
VQNLDWDDLRYFLAVARTGSLSAAARSLAVNHSTVLRRLSALEARLEARLFERYHTGYQMTPAGEELHTRLQPVAAQIEGIERRLGGLDSLVHGTIRLTTTDTLAHGLLAPSLAAFRRLHPRIQLQVVVQNTFLNLTKREADVAVRPSNRPPENLVGRRAGAIQTAIYASKAYLRQAAKARRSPTDWQAHPWVAPDESLGHLAQARWLAAHVPPGQVALTADSLVAMADAVRAGTGLGLLLCLLAEPDRELVRLTHPLPELDTQVWILTHPDLRKLRRVQALTDHLLESLGRHPFLVRVDQASMPPRAARARR